MHLKHFIENNIYNLEKDGKKVVSIELDEEYQAVKITTEKEVFEGPIELISLTADVDAEAKKRKNS